jgi:hypothetical protein
VESLPTLIERKRKRIRKIARAVKSLPTLIDRKIIRKTARAVISLPTLIERTTHLGTRAPIARD